MRYCKALSLKGHPARFPAAIPDFFIKFLTDKDDLVLDIFSGSNTTGFVAEKLGRRWLSYEQDKEFVATSSFRFVDSSEQANQNYQSIMSGDFISIVSPTEPEQLTLD